MEIFNKMKNKILFVTNQAPHYRIPLFNKLAEELNIKFVFTHERKKIKGLIADYISLKGIGYKKYKVHPELIKIIKDEKPSKVILIAPDPIHLINDLIMFRYIKKKKIPYSISVGRWEYKNTPLKQRITEPFYKKILQNADKLIVYGTKSEEWLLNKKIPKSKIVKAYNINPEIYSNFIEKKKKLSKFKNKKVILYVGRLIKRKGIEYLIKAFWESNIKNTILVIAGGGDFYKLGAKSEEAKLKKLVKDLKIKNKVFFTGSLSPKETKKYYKSADIFVCPSITLSVGEAWGHVVEEAMSFGLPIVTTDAVGAAYDLIRNRENGLIVHEKNSKELKDAMIKILKDEKLRKAMEKESLRIIKQKKFGFEEIVKKWEEGLK